MTEPKPSELELKQAADEYVRREYNPDAPLKSPTPVALRYGFLAGAKWQLNKLQSRPDSGKGSGVHGETCPKVPHDNPAGGYLHAADDDRPYDVDGCKYCGRCHRAI